MQSYLTTMTLLWPGPSGCLRVLRWHFSPATCTDRSELWPKVRCGITAHCLNMLNPAESPRSTQRLTPCRGTYVGRPPRNAVGRTAAEQAAFHHNLDLGTKWMASNNLALAAPNTLEALVSHLHTTDSQELPTQVTEWVHPRGPRAFALMAPLRAAEPRVKLDSRRPDPWSRTKPMLLPRLPGR